MISQKIDRIIQKELDIIEGTDDVRILYACESGSRAWGFESGDSDYDVRFFYIRPTAWYLTIQQKRDVIEGPINDQLDISGWDFPKTLELFRKSNPPLLEWLQSPIIYREIGSAAQKLRELMVEYYSPISCMYHYLHMAQGNYRQYLQGEHVWLKKYFYVLRPVLACLWIERGLGIVPTEFQKLVDHIIDDEKLYREIDRLIEKKKRGDECDQGKKIPVISDFLDDQIQRLTGENETHPSTRDPLALDDLFVSILDETYGNTFT